MTEPDYIVCPDCGTNYVDMDNYRNHKPCDGVRAGEPMDVAWRFLKGTLGSPEDKARADEQSAMWQKIQDDEKRQQQQQEMENPLCELCHRNPAVRESQHGELICRECDDAVMQNFKRLARESMGLPPEGE